MKTTCFTGHRPNNLNGYDISDNIKMLVQLKNIIIDHIENKGVTRFITGMALGVDMWSARLIFLLKDDYPEIELVCAIPCDKQWSVWRNDKVIEEWHDIVNKADEVHYVSNEPYTHWCLQRRNEWMVDNSDYVIAVWNGASGGTANCVKYANKKFQPITTLNPNTLEVVYEK